MSHVATDCTHCPHTIHHHGTAGCEDCICSRGTLPYWPDELKHPNSMATIMHERLIYAKDLITYRLAMERIKSLIDDIRYEGKSETETIEGIKTCLEDCKYLISLTALEAYLTEPQKPQTML